MNLSKTGGAPSQEEKAFHKKLQALDLFNRDSLVYSYIENELQALSPAKAFDLFCHFCARRDTHDGYLLADYSSHRQKIIVNQMKQMLDSQKNDLTEPLNRLYTLSEHIFVNYMEILYYDYGLLHNQNITKTNNFSYNITASFSWGYLSPYYDETQRIRIFDYIFNNHMQSSEELRLIYEKSSDKASLKSLHALLILNNQRVPIVDVVSDPTSPFYLEDRVSLDTNLKITRYEDIEYFVEEKQPKNSAKPYSYKPNATIHINMHKPISYIQEMLSFFAEDWTNNNDLLGLVEADISNEDKQELRKKIMSFHRRDKTLAEKLTDLLYIHDCRQFGFSNTWATANITKNFNKKRKKGSQLKVMSSSTFYDYLKLVNKIINEKYYRYY